MARRKRNYRAEYRRYHGKPRQRRQRAARNRARRKMGLRKGDPREVHHVGGVARGNGRRNLQVTSRRRNRRKGSKRGRA